MFHKHTKNIVLVHAKPTIADVRSIMVADGGAAPLPIHAPISALDRRPDEVGAGKHGNKSQNWARTDAHER